MFLKKGDEIPIEITSDRDPEQPRATAPFDHR